MADPVMEFAARLGISRAQVLATDQLPTPATPAKTAGRDQARPIGELAGDAQHLAATLTADPPPPGDREGWVAGHRREIDRWRDLQAGIAVQRSALGVAALYDPAPHLIDTLGAPPAAGPDRQRWAVTAGRVEAYRAAHGIDDDTADVLGPRPDEVAGLVEWRHTRAAIDNYQHRHLDQGLSL
jgi:hypothetical protein